MYVLKFNEILLVNYHFVHPFQNCWMMSEKISQYYWTVEDVLLFYTDTVIIGFQTPLFLQIKPRTQSTQVSQHPNLCPCSLALTPPGALSHSQCPAWCLLTLGSIMLLLLGGSMELWQLPWWLRGPATRRGSHGNEGKDRRGRVCWRWASGHLGKGWSWGETATGEDAKWISLRLRSHIHKCRWMTIACRGHCRMWHTVISVLVCSLCEGLFANFNFAYVWPCPLKKIYSMIYSSAVLLSMARPWTYFAFRLPKQNQFSSSQPRQQRCTS